MKRCLVGILAALVAVVPLGAEDLGMRIVSGVGAKLRAAPDTRAPEVGRVPLGTQLLPVERSKTPATIGGRTDYWYQVSHGDREEWIFGGLTEPIEAGRPLDGFVALIKARLTREERNFAERLELFRFAARLASDVSDPARKPEFEMYRWRTLAFAAEAVDLSVAGSGLPAELRSEEAHLIFSEPAGQHMVKSDLFWDLLPRAKGQPYAETIAWTAAENPLPGETEGYPPAVFTVAHLTKGRYLKEFPDGVHAAAAVKQISEYFGMFTVDAEAGKPVAELTAEEAREARATLGELRETVSRVPASVSGQAGLAAILIKLEGLLPPATSR